MSFVNLIDVKTDDITDYLKTSLLLVTPKCSGKCGEKCQNYFLIKNATTKQYAVSSIVNLYNNLTTHNAVVFAGLEPFDTFNDTQILVDAFLQNDKPIDIVIYTGYYQQSITDKVNVLLQKLIKTKSTNKTIIIKFGPYIAENRSYYSNILGIKLATDNQYVKRFYLNSENKLCVSIDQKIR